MIVNSIRPVVAQLVLAMVLGCSTSMAHAYSYFQGLARYQSVGQGVVLSADAIVNNDPSHSTQPLRLELWALPSPFPSADEQSSYKLAQVQLPELPPGGEYSNYMSSELPLGPLPDGTWYITLLLSEFVESGDDDGYAIDDWVSFPVPVLIGPAQGIQPIVEYYFATSDTYFITGIASEITALDSGQFPGWERTGYQFFGYDPAQSQPPGTVAVCRFFNDSFGTTSSHFYALHGLGCEDTIAKFPDWQLESLDAFSMKVPDANGSCAAGTIPVYRLFNNGMGGTPNHRYTISADLRGVMIAAGWTPEGYGIGVEFCAPQ
jgi:hypothetical protein